MARPARRASKVEQTPDPKDPNADLLESFKDWLKASRDHSHQWRIEGRLCYDFVAGQQWDDEDAQVMKDQQRPIVTFNRVSSVVDSVSGLEVANRQEVRYIPRQLGASGVNQLLTEAAKWIRDECQAEDEESDSFLDLITCGEGCTETRIDYDEDPDGKVWVCRVDPLEIFWDATSRRANHTDARHVFRVRKVPKSEAREMFPDASDDDLDGGWADDSLDSDSSPHDATAAPYYKNDQSADADKTTDMVTLVEVQWWEHAKGWRVADPVSGKILTLDEEQYGQLSGRAKQIGLQLTAVPTRSKKYRRAYIGAKVLKVVDGPEKGGFTYKAMTGKRDRNKGVFYGLVRAMIDPQRWANKWLAQVMHMINTQAKGGLFAEQDAFVNAQEAIDEYALTGSVTLLTEGALAKGKVKEKSLPQFPSGVAQLMQFAISSIRDVSGVNLELLGQAAIDQPGIVEHQRKQAGMTILAGLFDSLRQYRKEQGKLLLWFIVSFLADGRLVRIGGPQEAQYVPLLHDPNIIEFDVIVDDTPTSANMKEQTWAVLVQMMPFMAKMNLPMPVWLSVMRESPLPASFVAEFEQALQQGQQMAQQQQQQSPNPQLLTAQARAQTEQIRQHGIQIQSQAEMARAGADVQVAQAQAFKSHAEGVRALHDANATHVGTQQDSVRLLMDGLAQAHEQQLAQQQVTNTADMGQAPVQSPPAMPPFPTPTVQ